MPSFWSSISSCLLETHPSSSSQYHQPIVHYWVKINSAIHLKKYKTYHIMEIKLAPYFEYLDNPTLMSMLCSITETNNSTSGCRKQFERKYLLSSCSSLLEAYFPSFLFVLSLLINPQRKVETCKYISYKNTANFCTKNQK